MAFVFSLGCVYSCSHLPSTFDRWVLVFDFFIQGFSLVIVCCASFGLSLAFSYVFRVMVITVDFYPSFNFQISFKISLHNIWNYILFNLMLEKKKFVIAHFESKDIAMYTSYIYSNFWQWKLIEINLLLERSSGFQILSAMRAFFLEQPFFLVRVIFTIIKLFLINADFLQN